MKKIIIIAAIIISSGFTAAYCLNAKQNTVSAEKTLKINTADFAVKSSNSVSSAVGSAD